MCEEYIDNLQPARIFARIAGKIPPERKVQTEYYQVLHLYYGPDKKQSYLLACKADADSCEVLALPFYPLTDTVELDCVIYGAPLFFRVAGGEFPVGGGLPGSTMVRAEIPTDNPEYKNPQCLEFTTALVQILLFDNLPDRTLDLIQ